MIQAFQRLGQRKLVNTTPKLSSRITSGGWQRGCAAVAHPQPPWRVLGKHFACCALPMVGFGFMDNTILIRAGDAIDRYFGAEMKLPSIVAAACGQVVSDFSGVCFGGAVESISRRFLIPPVFTESQAALRVTQLFGVGGAAIGVVIGCLLGMANLLTMDLEEADRLKRFAELQEVFEVVIESARENIGATMGSVFLVDEENNELYSHVATDLSTTIRLPISRSSITATACIENRPVIVPDAYADPRFNPTVDLQTGRKTKNMMAFPVTSQKDPSKVIAVVMLLNKEEGFSEADQATCRMLSIHLALFLAKCEQ
eukprot:TRINITY_DN76679_c0_g1_i1.p1 TRINITY_DN76679_c0_g1~~TRINITY_DN76679_c0_g1_i1.p1  ORF type:complete len:338 (-),score=55.64 TRINITY_DN76679_c0_g1_i1:101-1042(-)